MSTIPSVLALRDSGMDGCDLLEGKLSTPWTVASASVRDEPEAARARAATADAIVGGPLPGGVPPGARLRLYHAPFAGYDWIGPDDLPAGVAFCNTHEHETTIAEHLLAAMLEWRTGLMRESHPRMRANSWDGRNIVVGPHKLEMRGATVGIVGYGRIGRETARRCKAFDMRVMALSRSGRGEPGLVDWRGTPDRLGELLAESDFVVVCLPGGAATRGYIGAAEFAAMKPEAVVANVGRAETIDEAALYAALAGRRIGGAIIDVWYRYPTAAEPNPWPSRFPFHRLDNVIMSPHASAWTAAMTDRRWSFVAANLDRLARGEPLLDIRFEGTRRDGARGAD